MILTDITLDETNSVVQGNHRLSALAATGIDCVPAKRIAKDGSAKDVTLVLLSCGWHVFDVAFKVGRERRQ